METPGEPDVAARLSTALKRLAALRARSHGDWSNGPATLIDVGNAEEPSGAALCWSPTLGDAGTPDLFELQPPPPPVVAPMALRGRFSDVADALPPPGPIDVSWLDLVDVDDPAAAQSTDDDALSAAIDAMALAEAVPEIVEIDDVEPAFAVGAAPGVLDMVQGAAAESAAPVTHSVAIAADVEDIDNAYAFGATADLIALFAFVDIPAPSRIQAAPAPEDDAHDALTALAFGAAPGMLALVLVADPSPAPSPQPSHTIADDDAPPDVPCAAFDLFALLALTAPDVVEDQPAQSRAQQPVETVETILAVGAFTLWFDDTPEPAAAEPVSTAVAADDTVPDIAFGAAPMLAALLEIVPAEDNAAPVVRAFDPDSLIDDALADAFEALLCAPEPIDPFEAAWTPDAIAATDTAAQLAACETQLWGLPRHVPCAETFLLSPNNEIAVRITRALRVRANMLEARAFTDAAAFGSLRSDTDAQALWFMADALHDAASLSAGDTDVDASFADWRMNEDGLIVVTAPDNAHPKRPPPLISEAELDALFAHVDDAQSRVVLDDLSDDPTWNDTFWCDVDTYLEHVSETMDPAVLDHTDATHDVFEIHDIEVRSAPEPIPAATFFWMPGDDFDLVVDGDGGDLFIVGANETPAVVLVEDGSTYAMRTGKAARMDEVIVSLSFDAWSYIDGMQWRRLATLSGIAHVRVEQNTGATRHAVVAGTFFATTLEDDGVRLVLSGDEGDVDHPVTRLGGVSFDAGSDWTVTDATAPRLS